MAAVDRNAAALDVSTKQLMESSGNALAREVRTVADSGDEVAVVAGRGNNGGDAFVAARFLAGDCDVTVHLLGRPETITTEIARENWDALRAAEIATERVRDSNALDLGSPDVVLDGVLGTGVTGAPREPERSAIVATNDADATVVSVDIPSGMDADTGEVADVAVEADHVVTFHALKPGLEGREDVTVADIGIPEAAERFVGPGDLLSLSRDPQAHKGDFGRVMVVGGGPYTGAPALCAQAALRAGADLAYVACPDPVADEVQGYAEDLIVEPYVGTRLQPEHVPDLLADAEARDVVVIGPGLGGADDTLDAVRAFLEGYEGKAVVDADALQVVPAVETDAELVCTPHQGELATMGGPRRDDWEEREALVAEFARDLGQTLLVKGAYDVVADGDATRVNRTGNPGMTVGGTGDVLAGITGALYSTQDAIDAAAIAAYANGTAGDAVVDEMGYGLLASDLLAKIPTALWGERR
ncbi:NAD(P)H-hydrate dehydratase [Halarchaeum sp. CBA1220]|uniref:NAD(P)H-hydrate dehydratase n=1 Tax=Halarchaeum sp. CBA1220 TaxID=1853682 RepID=UPI000F3A80A0|nr:NAD(P)H-hydrate dehydratase [Halarchaeum sp. CBA1220]QLC34708.1 NAD(P)H-hydrate dehydratase [Halarchaeum sp. CBA1220]